jgi:hypothetical protein
MLEAEFFHLVLRILSYYTQTKGRLQIICRVLTAVRMFMPTAIETSTKGTTNPLGGHSHCLDGDGMSKNSVKLKDDRWRGVRAGA